MKFDFLSLHEIDRTHAYKGPLILLKRLDATQDQKKSKCEGCGKAMDLVRVYKVPNRIVRYLFARGLLARMDVFGEVVVFDTNNLEKRVDGYKEKQLCAKCFFTKHLYKMGPTCPFCKKIIQVGSSVYLIKLGSADVAKLLNVTGILRAETEDDKSFLSCCLKKNRKMLSKGVFNCGTLMK